MNNSLRARLRRRRDRDIRQGLEQLEEQRPNKKLEQGELSDLIRDGMRKVLIEKGVLGDGATTEPNRRDPGQLALFMDSPQRQ